MSGRRPLAPRGSVEHAGNACGEGRHMRDMERSRSWETRVWEGELPPPSARLQRPSVSGAKATVLLGQKEHKQLGEQQPSSHLKSTHPAFFPSVPAPPSLVYTELPPISQLSLQRLPPQTHLLMSPPTGSLFFCFLFLLSFL